MHSCLLATILNRNYGIPLGKKGDMKVPRLVLASHVLASAMVRAAFDAEGDVQSGDTSQKSAPRRIVITNTSKSYLKCVEQALRYFGIESRTYLEARPHHNVFRLAVYRQESIRKFVRYVKPFHPKKCLRLACLLRTYQKNRLPELSLRPKILHSVSGGNNTRRMIANDLGLSLSQVGNQLYRLRKLALVARPNVVTSNHGRWGIYRLTAKGELLLRRFTDRGFPDYELH